MPHIHEKIDYTAEVFIVYQDKVLLRQHDKYKKWLSVGGHVELDEDPNQAAVREVMEEVGLEVKLYSPPHYQALEQEGYKELIPPEFMNIHRINDIHRHTTLVYFATSNTDQLILSEDEKSDGCKWFTKKELDHPEYGISETIKMYARAALEKLAKP
ncbi:MAG TPA: NUDIX domain-containing protein [Candidatus Nanoarchaeia archaeon]|nr:NUDIX domain-containing protein [Candidatus Nanoarchaeia archaeon]